MTPPAALEGRCHHPFCTQTASQLLAVAYGTGGEADAMKH